MKQKDESFSVTLPTGVAGKADRIAEESVKISVASRPALRASRS